MFRKTLVYIIFIHSSAIYPQINLHYFNKDIPQSNYLNPAQIPACKLIIGIPFINGTGIYAAHNGFVYNDLFENINTTDVVTTNGINKTIDKIGKRNYLMAGIELSDLFIGYKYNDLYFNVAVRDRIISSLFYNKDLLRLGLEGNTPFEGQTASFQGTGLLANYFRQYSLGIAFDKNDYFKWGTHINILFGKANVSTFTRNTGLFTHEETFALTSDANGGFNSSMPYVLYYNANGDLRAENRFDGIAGFLLERQNKGVTLDAGFIYEYDASTTIYGSILDVGFIGYKKNTSNFEATGTFNYNGPGENEVFNQNYFQEIINTLDDSIDISLQNEKYRYFLPPRLFLGARYNIGSIITYQALYGSVIYRQKYQQFVSLGTEIELGKHVDAMLNWSLAHRSVKNIGAGFNFDFHPVNFYIVTDNILGFFWYRSTKNVNLQFGFNLKFGCREKDSKEGCGCGWIKYPKSYQERIKNLSPDKSFE